MSENSNSTPGTENVRSTEPPESLSIPQGENSPVAVPSGGIRMVGEHSRSLSSKALIGTAESSSSISQLLHQTSGRTIESHRTLSDLRGLGKQATFSDMGAAPPNMHDWMGCPPEQQGSVQDVTFGKYNIEPQAIFSRTNSYCNESQMQSTMFQVQEVLNAPPQNSVPKCPSQILSKHSGDFGDGTPHAERASDIETNPNRGFVGTTGKRPLAGISFRASQLAVRFSKAAEHAAMHKGAQACSDGSSVDPKVCSGGFQLDGCHSRQLLDRMRRDDDMNGMKLLLSCDKPIEELTELAFDERKLRQTVRKLEADEAQKQKRPLRVEEWDHQQRQNPRRVSRLESVGFERAATCRRPVGPLAPLGRAEFEAELRGLPGPQRNARIVEQLALALKEMRGRNRSWEDCLQWMDQYKCFDPDSRVVNTWTVIYVALILYIATWGIFNTAFAIDGGARLGRRGGVEDGDVGDCEVTFSAQQWFEAAVDLFFLVDVVLRLFAFGYVEESSERIGSLTVKETLPSKVFLAYVRRGLLVDLFTAAPITWVSMALEAECSEQSTGLLMARGMRIFRVTRVVKLFRTYKVRMWLRRLQRVSGNTSVMQIMHLVLLLFFLNHIWSCVSWVVQSVDEQGFEDWRSHVGIREGMNRYEEYSLTFMYTLQVLFAIDAYSADSMLEAWFGSVTLALAVFISATMLSKILEIWQMANEAQTQRDMRMNTVMQFAARNGIAKELRDEVLDYFEFRYSSPTSDFEKFILDDLPSEMQTRMISQMFPSALEKSALFKSAPELFTAHLIVKMARHPTPTMPNQVILKHGAFSSDMFLLTSGTVEVSVEDEDGQKRTISVLEKGATFGDLSLWMDACQTVTVTSREFCQLHKLGRQDLEEACLAFPEMASIIASQALAQVLRNRVFCPALDGIGSAAAERIARRMARNRVEVDPGMALYREGEEAHCGFVVRKGRVGVGLLGERLESLEDARCVGFDALCTGRDYQETVRAVTPVVAYWLSSEDMLELFAGDLPLLQRIEAQAERFYAHQWSHRARMRWARLAKELLERSPARKASGRGHCHWNVLRSFALSGSSPGPSVARGFSSCILQSQPGSPASTRNFQSQSGSPASTRNFRAPGTADDAHDTTRLPAPRQRGPRLSMQLDGSAHTASSSIAAGLLPPVPAAALSPREPHRDPSPSADPPRGLQPCRPSRTDLIDADSEPKGRRRDSFARTPSPYRRARAWGPAAADSADASVNNRLVSAGSDADSASAPWGRGGPLRLASAGPPLPGAARTRSSSATRSLRR